MTQPWETNFFLTKNEWWWVLSTKNVDVQTEILISSHTSMEISSWFLVLPRIISVV